MPLEVGSKRACRHVDDIYSHLLTDIAHYLQAVRDRLLLKQFLLSFLLGIAVDFNLQTVCHTVTYI